MSVSPDSAGFKAKEAPEVPTRLRTQTVISGGILALLVFAALREASVIAIPFVLALILKLVFYPVACRMQKAGLPRPIACFCIVGLLFGGIGLTGAGLSSTAADWADRIEDQYPRIEKRLNFIHRPLVKTQELLHHADDLAAPSSTKKTIAIHTEPKISDRLISATQAIAGGIFTTFLILLFMLMQGDTFLRRFVEILPSFRDKRRAVDIAYEIEKDVSRYLLTITVINAGVGCLAGAIMALCGVEDALMWGVFTFLLNYIPIVGPVIVAAIFFLVGMMSIPDPVIAFVPAAGFIIVHMLEGSLITPMMLARRFTINPVLVILSLLFWSWMWGIVGAIISMPILAIVKIVCDRIERLSAVGHLLEV